MDSMALAVRPVHRRFRKELRPISPLHAGTADDVVRLRDEQVEIVRANGIQFKTIYVDGRKD